MNNDRPDANTPQNYSSPTNGPAGRHAKRELEILQFSPFDGLTIVDIARQLDHDFPDPVKRAEVVAMLQRLAAYKPLSPLTGETHEWRATVDMTHPLVTKITETHVHFDDGAIHLKLYQNIRCPSVFKQGEQAWDEDSEPLSSSVPDSPRERPITFPYMPPLPSATRLRDRAALSCMTGGTSTR